MLLIGCPIQNVRYKMRFEALYYGQRLEVVNPYADVGVVTLWSTVKSVTRLLQQQSIDLDPATSRIAVVANLYGNGLPQMLRNLLYNPQIRSLVVLGRDLSDSKLALCNFFEYGLEEVCFLGTAMHRIIGTRHLIDCEVLPEHFSGRIVIETLGLVGDPKTKAGLRAFFDRLPPSYGGEQERTEAPIPTVSVQRYPSEARSHTLVRDTPLDAWEELIFRLHRFGHHNKVAKRSVDGTPYSQDRIELQNVHVVIQRPREDPAKHLEAHQFSLESFHAYQQKILDASEPPQDLTYTYGNRLRGYFKDNGQTVDSLQRVSKQLLEHPESRHAYIVLWDPSRDLVANSGHPCFVSAFFRHFEGKLTVTATFRTHNALDGWLKNAYGLIAIQRFVAEQVQMQPGAITIISHSISLSPADAAKAEAIARSKQTDMVVDRDTGKCSLRFDPNGSVKITVDEDTKELVVEHSYEGVTIGQYRAKSAQEMENALARDCVVSDVHHAFYVGRELTKAEMRLKTRARINDDPA